jgi:hypothetical protein
MTEIVNFPHPQKGRGAGVRDTNKEKWHKAAGKPPPGIASRNPNGQVWKSPSGPGGEDINFLVPGSRLVKIDQAARSNLSLLWLSFMVIDFLPFTINISPAFIAGSCLWSLALYLGLAGVRNWFIEIFYRWFNFAERFLYTSLEEFEKTRVARESQNAFYASIFSIIPFLILGGFSDWLIEISLGKSWPISVGILACVACGVYELGRQDGSGNQ